MDYAPRLGGLKVVLDVQHLYRVGLHAADRGTRYTLADGSHVLEGEIARHYADAAAVALRGFGATVWTNDPGRATLIGYYGRRQMAANIYGAHCYLACHLNAGMGRYTMTRYMAGQSGTAAGPFAAESKRLGDSLVRQWTEAFRGAISGGVTSELLLGERGAICIKGFQGPAVICEPLFGDYEPHQHLLNIEGLVTLGEALARGVADWWQRRRIVQ